jgi:hypothetical protein
MPGKKLKSGLSGFQTLDPSTAREAPRMRGREEGPIDACFKLAKGGGGL